MVMGRPIRGDVYGLRDLDYLEAILMMGIGIGMGMVSVGPKVGRGIGFRMLFILLLAVFHIFLFSL